MRHNDNLREKIKNSDTYNINEIFLEHDRLLHPRFTVLPDGGDNSIHPLTGNVLG